MSENERIQPERTGTPPLQQGYWVAGILSFILVMISYLGAVFPILPGAINVAMLVGAATVFISRGGESRRECSSGDHIGPFSILMS